MLRFAWRCTPMFKRVVSLLSLSLSLKKWFLLLSKAPAKGLLQEWSYCFLAQPVSAGWLWERQNHSRLSKTYKEVANLPGVPLPANQTAEVQRVADFLVGPSQKELNEFWTRDCLLCAENASLSQVWPICTKTKTPRPIRGSQVRPFLCNSRPGGPPSAGLSVSSLHPPAAKSSGISKSKGQKFFEMMSNRSISTLSCFRTATS